jgi:hypothetical protein
MRAMVATVCQYIEPLGDERDHRRPTAGGPES